MVDFTSEGVFLQYKRSIWSSSLTLVLALISNKITRKMANVCTRHHTHMIYVIGFALTIGSLPLAEASPGKVSQMWYVKELSAKIAGEKCGLSRNSPNYPSDLNSLHVPTDFRFMKRNGVALDKHVHELMYKTSEVYATKMCNGEKVENYHVLDEQTVAKFNVQVQPVGAQPIPAIQPGGAQTMSTPLPYASEAQAYEYEQVHSLADQQGGDGADSTTGVFPFLAFFLGIAVGYALSKK